ncbi:MAG: hypothetical protein WCV79_04480, partial [Candidatus Paceibacterota bacterium]
FDRCTRISYGNGQEKNITYDSRGKVIRIENAVRNTEDLYSHISKTIQSVDFVYDQFDRVTSKTYTKATVPFKQFASEKKEEKTTHEYSYTNSSKRKSLVVTFADGSKKVNEWSYDKLGRLEKIKDNGQEVVYKYDEKSRLSEKVIAGLSEFYQYDSQGRLTRKALGNLEKPIADLKYLYSKDGMITAREVNGKLQNYEYDLKSQLVGVKDKDGKYAEQYVYDKAGNILKKTVNGKETIFSYDAANQLVSSSLKTENLTLETDYQYDGAGRLSKEGEKSYSYGWLDKVLKVEDSEKVSTFEYYADGQIAERHSNDVEEDFAWDGLALIGRNATRYTVEPHVNGGSPILADGKVILNDILGSSLGSVENGKFSAVDRTSFGESLSSVSSMSHDFFTGKPNIEGLGYAFLFRNYRSDLGKWQTADPLGYIDGWNNTAYCNNRVTNCFDFLGGWTVEAHNAILAGQFSNMSPDDIAAIQTGSSYVDRFPGGQGSSTAYQHSMSAPGQSAADAIELRNSFISESLALANLLIDSNRNNALEYMGQALHAIQDSYCPLHVDSNGNPIEWSLSDIPGVFGHVFGDEDTEDLTQGIVDQIQQTSANYLMNYSNLVNAITPRPE